MRSWSPSRATRETVSDGSYRAVRVGVILPVTAMIYLQTFGAVDLRRDAAQVRSVLTQPKRLALLAYLTVAEPRGFHARERLLALFWPESDQERARNSLRQSLHYLRRSLGEDVIISRGDEVSIDPERLRCDAVAFDAAVSGDRPAEAVDLYGGEFLAGLFVDDAPDVERWMEERRTHYRRAAAGAARAASEAEAGRGGLGAAVLLARRALAIAPHDEAALAHLLGLHKQTGDRAAALQDFESFARRLDVDLGLEPSDASRALLDEVVAEAAGVRTPVQEAPAAMDAPEPSSAPTRSPSPGPPRPLRVRPALVVAALVVTLAVATFLVRGLLRSDRETAVDRGENTGRVEGPVEGPTAVAVLPFLNISGDPEREYLSDGMADEITTALARVPELRVVARTSSFGFRQATVGVDSIARALRASHVVEGSVREDGGRVRVTAQLVDGRSGYQLWSDTFEGEASDVFGMQDSIARAVVAALEPVFGFTGSDQAFARPPAAEAHAEYLRGQAARGRDTPEGLRQAERYYRRATELDPEYARPWAGLAELRTVDSYRQVLAEDAGYDEARAFAERALALDPTLAAPHVVLGRIAAHHEWNFAAAERHFRRALELEPGSVTAMRGFARTLTHLGRKDEALELSRRALDLDPVAPIAHRWMGTAYMLTGEHERAVEVLEGVVALSPDNLIGSMALALALAALERHEEAVAAVERVLRNAPDEQLYVAHAAAIYAGAGDSAQARALLAHLDALPRPAAYYRAMILGALGDVDGAFRELGRALAARESLLVQVGAMPPFDVLKGDSRFDDVLRSVGLRPGP